MTTASRRKNTPAPTEEHPPGDTGSDALNAATVIERVGSVPVVNSDEPIEVPDAEGHAEELDEAASRRAAAAAANPFARIGSMLNADFRAGYQLAVSEFAADQRDDNPLTVHEAIAEVTRRVEHIAKDRRAESGERYAYRGIDDVLLALHPILGDVGLVVMPGRIVEHRRETRATAKGGTLNVAMVRVRYRLVGPDGSRLTGEAWGEAHDSGDKATQKALSQAYKSFALQLFSIPTEASADDDPDRTNEPARPFSTDERTRAFRAWQAAKDADDLPALADVRRRAEHLLPVPIDGGDPDGALAPLSYWFERRLLQLSGEGGDRG